MAWSASYRARLNRRSTTRCTGLGSATAAGVEAAVATVMLARQQDQREQVTVRAA
jgi:hypothetical protein